MEQNNIIKEKKRLELYIKLNYLLITRKDFNTHNSDEIKRIKFYLLFSIYSNLLNIQNILKGIKINDTIQNYVDPNVVANNCRALLERCALYNYLFNQNNQELTRFLVSIYKYQSLNKVELDEDKTSEKIKLEEYKQKELDILQKYCMYNDINFKNIKDIINDHYFRGFIEINDQQIHKLGYAKIIENCTSNKCFKNLYHFLSNKTHPSFVSITTFKSSINKSDYLEKSYQYVFETLFYVNYIFSLFQKEFNFEKEIHSLLSEDEKDLIYSDLEIFTRN